MQGSVWGGVEFPNIFNLAIKSLTYYFEVWNVFFYRFVQLIYKWVSQKPNKSR